MSLGAALVALSVAAAGGAVLALFLRHLARRRAMKRWPVVAGTVLGHRVRGGGPGEAAYVDHEVAFSYDGVDRLAWCPSPTGSGYGRGTGRDVVERQAARKRPVGSAAAVRFNPARPEEAYLELPEAHILAMLATGGTALLGAVAALVLPAWLGLPEEVVLSLFTLVLAAGLVAVAVTAGIALLRR